MRLCLASDKRKSRQKVQNSHGTLYSGGMPDNDGAVNKHCDEQKEQVKKFKTIIKFKYPVQNAGNKFT